MYITTQKLVDAIYMHIYFIYRPFCLLQFKGKTNANHILIYKIHSQISVSVISSVLFSSLSVSTQQRHRLYNHFEAARTVLKLHFLYRPFAVQCHRHCAQSTCNLGE